MSAQLWVQATSLLPWAARKLAVFCAAFLALFSVTAFVLWDVDLQKVRDRFERAKAALLGPSSSTDTDFIGADDQGASFEERMESGLLFITGRRSTYLWCYVRWDGGAHDADRSLQVGQGLIIGGSPLMTWNELTNEQTAIFGLAPAALSAAAKRGCVLE